MRKIFCLSLSLLVLGAAFSMNMNKGRSAFLQGVKNVFHFFESDANRPGAKEYPEKFERDIKKQLRYPNRGETK